MSWAAAALVAPALIIVITRPFAWWPLVSLVLGAAGMTLAFVARRRAIRRRRTQGLVAGLVAFIVGLILVVYLLPSMVVALLIATS